MQWLRKPKYSSTTPPGSLQTKYNFKLHYFYSRLPNTAVEGRYWEGRLYIAFQYYLSLRVLKRCTMYTWCTMYTVHQSNSPSEEMRTKIFRFSAGILHLGNIDLKANKRDEGGSRYFSISVIWNKQIEHVFDHQNLARLYYWWPNVAGESLSHVWCKHGRHEQSPHQAQD